MTLPDLFVAPDFKNRVQRISETMRCRRQRVIVGRGHTLDEPSPRLQGIYERGEQIETYGIKIARREFGDEWDYIEQADVTTPFGSGHIDLACINPVDGMDVVIIDVKSRTLPHRVSDDYIWQIRAYGKFWHDEFGVRPRLFLLYVDPSMLQHTWFEIQLTDEHAAMIEAEERAIADLVTRRLERSEYPERTCDTPEQGAGRFCPVVGECFREWQPEPNGEITDDAVIELAKRLAKARAERSKLQAQVKAWGDIVDELQNALEHAAPAGQKLTAGPVTLKRSVSTRTMFDLTGAEKAGYMLPDDLEDFVSTSVGSRWTVEIDESELKAIDIAEIEPEEK